MTPDRLIYFRDRLEAERTALFDTREVSSESARPVILDQSSVGRVSRMDAMQGQAMAIETQRRRDIQLHRIDSALQRLARGNFGICLICDETIAMARLESDPAAPLCIHCASRQEQT